MDHEREWLDLINQVADISFGSLWWIKDVLWETVVPHFKMKDGRKKHPACCVRSKKFSSLFQTIPLLLGSHSFSHGFPANMVSAEENRTKKRNTGYEDGYFAIRQYNIAVYNVIGRDPGIERNSAKPTMTEYEKKLLKQFLHTHGVDTDGRN